MNFHALAVDYDGTLAHNGLVDEPTIDALKRLKSTGRQLVLVTGRRLEPLQELFPALKLFDLVVAENGAVLFNPADGQLRVLCDPVPPEFTQQLADLGVRRIESGSAIVATWQPHEIESLEVIRRLNLDLQIIFNKDAVMILPTGVNKAAGLKCALDELGISSLNTVAVGDAENDLAMLKYCGVSAAVDNALDTVKEGADLVLGKPRGAGVRELIDELLDNDLACLDAQLKRRLLIGHQLDGQPFTIDLFAESVLVTGGSGGGKSKFAMGFVEQLTQRGAQSVILDPEGDYQNIEGSIVLGTGDRPPEIEEVMRILDQPSGHFVVSFFRVSEEERPKYFDRLLHELSSMRSQKGRPHWIIVDEAHYAAPRQWQPAENWSAQQLRGVMFISAYHDRLSSVIMRTVDTVISIANDPADALQQCCQLLERNCDGMETPSGEPGEYAVAWRRGEDHPIWFQHIISKSDSQRHKHSYFDGEMDQVQRFVFRGPDRKLQLEVQNLKLFMQIGEGVDDETWEFHRNHHDYSKWFSGIIKDGELAEIAHGIESDEALSASASRQSIFDEIRKRFDPQA